MFFEELCNGAKTKVFLIGELTPTAPHGSSESNERNGDEIDTEKLEELGVCLWTSA